MLVVRPKTQDDSFKFSFVTVYSNQHYDIKKFIQKHWKVLQGDQVLGPIIPEQPQVVYRGVPPLRLQVAPNIVDPPKKVSFFPNHGRFLSM